MKTLNVAVICEGVYNSSIQVPDNFTIEEAIEYAIKNLQEIPAGEVEWLKDIEIDKNNCNFNEK